MYKQRKIDFLKTQGVKLHKSKRHDGSRRPEYINREITHTGFTPLAWIEMAMENYAKQEVELFMRSLIKQLVKSLPSQKATPILTSANIKKMKEQKKVTKKLTSHLDL